MPKDSGLASRRHSSRGKPYHHKHSGSHSSAKGAKPIVAKDEGLNKEWAETSCPICIEPPHNAVMLVCESYDKGCRPYMCDTSYRHSNCFDQYKKTQQDSPQDLGADGAGWSRSLVEDRTGRTSNARINLGSKSLAGVVCPLCRSNVTGWIVVKGAREYLNSKKRSCSREECPFVGTYEELRKHARSDHPLARPAEADPVRERAWSDLEREQDIGDILSSISSSLPASTIMGDYVVEAGNRTDEDHLEVGFRTLFLLFALFRPVGVYSVRPSSSSTSAYSSSNGSSSSSRGARNFGSRRRRREWQ